jgi:hypothetical protein
MKKWMFYRARAGADRGRAHGPAPIQGAAAGSALREQAAAADAALHAPLHRCALRLGGGAARRRLLRADREGLARRGAVLLLWQDALLVALQGEGAEGGTGAWVMGKGRAVHALACALAPAQGGAAGSPGPRCSPPPPPPPPLSPRPLTMMMNLRLPSPEFHTRRRPRTTRPCGLNTDSGKWRRGRGHGGGEQTRKAITGARGRAALAGLRRLSPALCADGGPALPSALTDGLIHAVREAVPPHEQVTLGGGSQGWARRAVGTASAEREAPLAAASTPTPAGAARGLPGC